MSNRFISSITSLNLHRWINHSNINCGERMSKCMTLQWEDYNTYSNKMVTLEKKIDGIEKKLEFLEIQRTHKQTNQPQTNT